MTILDRNCSLSKLVSVIFGHSSVVIDWSARDAELRKLLRHESECWSSLLRRAMRDRRSRRRRLQRGGRHDGNLSQPRSSPQKRNFEIAAATEQLSAAACFLGSTCASRVGLGASPKQCRSTWTASGALARAGSQGCPDSSKLRQHFGI